MTTSGSFFGRYEVLGTLGRGGFAIVYRVRDPTLNRQVALKALLPHLAEDPMVRHRFLTEAQAIARLAHPRIITIYEAGEASGQPYYTMELVDGHTLADALAPDRRLSLAEATELLRDLCSAVDYLHAAGIVHRDIKPANVMIDTSGHAKLMDFGIARVLEETQYTHTGVTLGTPAYMSPEQVLAQPVGPASDIYALGVLLYHMLAGRPPFVGITAHVLHAQAYEPPPPLRDFAPSLPEAVYRTIEAALAKPPSARPASATALLATLTAVTPAPTMPNLQTPPRPTPSTVPPTEPAIAPPSHGMTRRTALIAAGGVGVVAIGGAAAAVVVRNGLIGSSYNNNSPFQPSAGVRGSSNNNGANTTVQVGSSSNNNTSLPSSPSNINTSTRAPSNVSSNNNNNANTTVQGSSSSNNNAQPVATSSGQPRLGGSVSLQLPTAPPGLDLYTNTSFFCSYVNSFTYSKLFRFKAGVPEVAYADLTLEPGLAAAMPEIVGDTQLVVKIKPNAKWPAGAPTNGRALTSDDVKYAIDRYQNFDKSVHRSTWSFLDSMQTPDPQTIVFKLKYPYADFVNIAGGNLAAYISPKEHAESPDANTKMVGGGYFLHTDYQTGVSLTYKKNPDFYDKPYPYFDELKAFIVFDEAKRLADFAAKSVDLTYSFLPEQRDQLKKQRPDAKFEEQQGIGGYIYLRTDKPPFNDKRVRQALSMSIDRKAIRDSLTKGEGVNDQALFVGFTDIARQVKDLGAPAKYWDYNPGDAKKLLDAAGASNLNFQWSHADASVYTQAYVDTATLTQAQWKQIGITVQDNQQSYAQYISSTYQGMFDGVGHSPRAIPYFLDGLYEQFYWSASGQRARINLSYVNDPMLNALLDKQRTQYDINERKKTFTQIEDIVAEQQYQIYYSTDTRTYFWAPNIQNYRPTAFSPYTPPMKAWRG